MKKASIFMFAASLLLSACNSSDNKSSLSPEKLTDNKSSLSPEKLSDANWKNGVWILKDGRNGFFIAADAGKVQLPVGAKLTFAKSGERVVTEVVVSTPYINIYVDKPLDPDGDGFPSKVTQSH